MPYIRSFFLFSFVLISNIGVGQIALELEIKSDNDLRLQIFFKTDTTTRRFTEEKSAYKRVEASSEFQKVRRVLNVGRLSDLRIDFGDKADNKLLLRSATLKINEDSIFWNAKDFLADFYSNYDISIENLTSDELAFRTIQTARRPDPYFQMVQSARSLLYEKFFEGGKLFKISYEVKIQAEKGDRIGLTLVDENNQLFADQTSHKIIRANQDIAMPFNFYVNEISNRFYLGLGTSERNIFLIDWIKYQSENFNRLFDAEKLNQILSDNQYVTKDVVNGRLHITCDYYDGEYLPAVWTPESMVSRLYEIVQFAIKIVAMVFFVIVAYWANKKFMERDLYLRPH